MPDWLRLGSELAVKSRRARESAELVNSRRQTQREYQAWAGEVVVEVVARLGEELASRASEFERSAGISYELRPPRRVSLETDSTDRCVLSLFLDGSNVDLYAQWTPGAPPAVHLLLSRQRGGRPARLVSIPGAWLARPLGGTGFELKSFEPERQDIELEELAYRAARLLLVH